MRMSSPSASCLSLGRGAAWFQLLLLSAAVGGSVGLPSCTDTLPDCDRSAQELIAAHGFLPQPHTCRTEDGFLLALFRILPRDPAMRAAPSRGTVLLMHGLLDSADTWLLNGRDKSLAFVLADAGFDVWLGNNRGNKYSTSHESLLPSDEAFWAWSWDQMARYDLPALVEYVSVATGGGKVSLVGHSQGSLQAFAALSLPTPAAKKLAKNLNIFIALAPVFYLSGMASPLLNALADVPEAEASLIFGKKDFLPSTDILKRLLPTVCAKSPDICKYAACAVSGCDPVSHAHYNTTRWPVYAAHYPAGASVRDMLHFRQMLRGADTRMFDFGSPSANKEAYGTSEPPTYGVGGVGGVEIALVCGGRDVLADGKDVARLVAELPAGVLVAHKVIMDWDHLAFTWGSDGAQLLFPEIEGLLGAVPPPPISSIVQ